MIEKTILSHKDKIPFISCIFSVAIYYSHHHNLTLFIYFFKMLCLHVSESVFKSKDTLCWLQVNWKPPTHLLWEICTDDSTWWREKRRRRIVSRHQTHTYMIGFWGIREGLWGRHFTTRRRKVDKSAKTKRKNIRSDSLRMCVRTHYSNKHHKGWLKVNIDFWSFSIILNIVNIYSGYVKVGKLKKKGCNI